ncbi:sensor histidine kinase [Pollutibacter soli]|uniref:sensor histidine kinase n=1 Tax=Pollutibacter soli TaxID=3034157 RepID=UPI003013C0CB
MRNRYVSAAARFTLSLFLCSFYSGIYSQEQGVLITPSMFNNIQEVFIGGMDGWHFRKGNDISWAAKDFDDDDWAKLSPLDLRTDMAENGRLEGWLRFRFIPDTSFGNILLGLRYYNWAAADLYLDGVLVSRLGSTGADGRHFHEFNPLNKLPIPVKMEKGISHVIAVHIRDTVVGFPNRILRLEQTEGEAFLRLTGPLYNNALARHINEWKIYYTALIAVCAILSLLFWLIYIQNNKEKNFFSIALCTSFLTFSILSYATSENGNNTYSAYQNYRYLFEIFIALSLWMMVIIIGQVFHSRIVAPIRIILAGLLLLGIFNMFFPDATLRNILVATVLGICVWYIATSWKKLRGAQWAIIVGMVLTLFWIAVFVYFSSRYRVQIFPHALKFVSAIYLSFPLGLLFYVSFRFREIISEVRRNAEEIVRLSEEKKEVALHQQRLLEEEVARQTSELRATVEHLRSTQSQLIQSEKMASLGQLTAGIAHEIQNPLNFVNNFSDLNGDLLQEMKEEISKGNFGEIELIATDVISNEKKINHHGKRADSIVKGMLQHSRGGSGQKMPMDINKFVDEYLRLAYHGYRGKDNSFQAAITSDLQEGIGEMVIVPQDIGRALVNVFNNAFYSVSQKGKNSTDEESITDDEGYLPTVKVSTRKIFNRIEISISDNGEGIPEKIIDKIFQPFFTTKPTGIGTGLGLSIAYDIIHAHQGEINVNSMPGEGAEFIIVLPITQQGLLIK